VRTTINHEQHTTEEKNIMQATQRAIANNNEYRNIPVNALVESLTNPRKRFDQTALEELAASF